MEYDIIGDDDHDCAFSLAASCLAKHGTHRMHTTLHTYYIVAFGCIAGLSGILILTLACFGDRVVDSKRRIASLKLLFFTSLRRSP